MIDRILSITGKLSAFTKGAALAAVAFGLAACASGGVDGPGATGSIDFDLVKGPNKAAKVALLLPLSSPNPQTAAIARAMKQAAELALSERERPGIRLMVKDDSGTADGAAAAARAALDDGAELILGPLFARSVQAVAPLARKAEVPVIAFSNDRSVAGNGVYLLSFMPSQDVARVVYYAAANGKRRFAAFIPDDAYGDIAEKLFRAAVQHCEGEVVAIERYPIDTEGMIAPAKRLKAAMRRADAAGEPVDALFVPGGEETLPMVAATLPYVNIDTRRVKLLGTTGWDSHVVAGERALSGAWFAAPDPGAWREFAGSFAKSTGSAPPRLASLAYDAVVLSAMVSAAPSGGRYGAVNLTRASGFNGADGSYRFLADGTSERALAVLELRPKGPAVLEAASQGFELKPVRVAVRTPKGPPRLSVPPPPVISSEPMPVRAPGTIPRAPAPNADGVIVINE